MHDPSKEYGEGSICPAACVQVLSELADRLEAACNDTRDGVLTYPSKKIKGFYKHL